MARILSKHQLSENVWEMKLSAADIARKACPGQFVIIRLDEKGERIPLTIADSDPESITIVFQAVGRSTQQLSALSAGQDIMDLCGPLGNARDIRRIGTIALVGGGVGIAAIYPEAMALKNAGNRVISVIGARTSSLLIWEERMRKVSDAVIVMTDDGSAGQKGLVTDALKNLLVEEQIDEVIAVGPVIMMKYVCLAAPGIKTTVSLNPIMIDGIGMCGACRVTVDGKTYFTCVDGPEFDGHKVDWDNLLARNRSYDEEECGCKTRDA